MPMFVISYDLRKVRNYQALYDVFAQWKAVRLLESLWLADLTGPAATIAQLLKAQMDTDDGVAVIELSPGFAWATQGVLPAGLQWLKQHSP